MGRDSKRGYKSIIADEVRPNDIILIGSKEIFVESVKFDGGNIVINGDIIKRPKSKMTREITWQEYTQSQFVPTFLQQPMHKTTQEDLEREESKKVLRLGKTFAPSSEWKH